MDIILKKRWLLFLGMLVCSYLKAETLSFSITDSNGFEQECTGNVNDAVSGVWKNNGVPPINIQMLSERAYESAKKIYFGSNKLIIKSIEFRLLTKPVSGSGWVLIYRFWINGATSPESGDIYVCISPTGDIWKHDFGSDL